MPPARTIAPKYNPGFLSDDQLIASFCVRRAELGLVLGMLRDCTGPSNAHQLVIGPRGSGKTTLLLRVAAEARRDDDLKSAFFPVVFSEESYGVSTDGEFWLEALTRLAADPAASRPDAPDLRASVREIRTVHDDAVLGARCLGALLDFSDREGKRLVLIVENLHMMFGDMGDADAEWRLREVLQTEPRIILLGSATSRFAEITDPGRALYEQFRILPLDPLGDEECRTLWEAESGRKASRRSVRPLQILTGGNPRLLAIVARFGAKRSFRRLMRDLFDLVDDHTEYFKGHIEALPPQERRVFLALAALWRPSTTREIANRARLDTNRCSAQLQRLKRRGAVRTAGGSPRRKQYYLSERLYNIYYLLRSRGGHAALVEALVRFMRAFYSSVEIEAIRSDLRRSSQDSDASRHSLATALRERLEPGSGRDATVLHNSGVALAAEGSFDEAIVVWEDLIERFGESDAAGVQEAVAATLAQLAGVLGVRGRLDDALARSDELVDRFDTSSGPGLAQYVARGLLNRGTALAELGRVPEAMAAWDDVARRFGENDEPEVRAAVALACVNRAGALQVLDRSVEALDALDAVVKQFAASSDVGVMRHVATGLVNKGNLLRELDRPEDAAAACLEVVSRFQDADDPELRDQVAKALVNHGTVLASLEKYSQALEAWEKCVARYEGGGSPELRLSVAKALSNCAVVMNGTGRWEEAAATADDIERRFGDGAIAAVRTMVAGALVQKGVALTRLERRSEALAVYEGLSSWLDESPELRPYAHHARLNGAALRLMRGERRRAIEIASQVLREDPDPPFRWMALAVRARAAANDDRTAAERDARELLEILADWDSPPRAAISLLVDISLGVGSQAMLSLIEASRAREFLLPLSTALARELGRSPRVSQEISEVAEDLGRTLRKARERARLSAPRDLSSPAPARERPAGPLTVSASA